MGYPTNDTKILEKIDVYKNIPENNIPGRFEALVKDAEKRRINLIDIVGLEGCPETDDVTSSDLVEYETSYILQLRLKKVID